MKKNNDRTETELIEDPKHLACVKKMAWHYYGFVPADKRGLITIEDLISAGNEGLVIAAGKYRAGSGAKFTTYLTKWIKGEIIRELTFYLGKDALLIDDAEKLAASEDPAADEGPVFLRSYERGQAVYSRRQSTDPHAVLHRHLP